MLDRYLRGVTGHVTHPIRSIVSRSLPAMLDRYLCGVTGHVTHPIRSIQLFSFRFSVFPQRLNRSAMLLCSNLHPGNTIRALAGA